MVDMDPLELLRTVCLSFPDVFEKSSHGEAAYFAKNKKQFAMSANHHHDDRLAVWCAAFPGVQESLVQDRPGSFFRPPYVGHRGWIGIYLDVPFDKGEFEGLLADAHAVIASKK